ncbi:hypothetical protein [Lewinella sp. W8]|uniref:hypothetical protein n=1 Tax=Lewinella sp. W8 TaxID=2528208 RepID=UPI00106821D6|nr:hypothetical protein [Lewinella sp. W8]MTB53453.1 hypothetical protein [Lewinella sp. W8]
MPRSFPGAIIRDELLHFNLSLKHKGRQGGVNRKEHSPIDMPAIWKYYLDTTLFNLGFSILVGLYAGPVWSLLTFASFGTGVGFLGYGYFREAEYYFYRNLGYTKGALMARVWVFNLIVVVIALGAFAIISKLFS